VVEETNCVLGFNWGILGTCGDRNCAFGFSVVGSGGNRGPTKGMVAWRPTPVFFCRGVGAMGRVGLSSWGGAGGFLLKGGVTFGCQVWKRGQLCLGLGGTFSGVAVNLAWSARVKKVGSHFCKVSWGVWGGVTLRLCLHTGGGWFSRGEGNHVSIVLKEV